MSEEEDEKGLKVNRRDFITLTGLGAAAAFGPDVAYDAWWRNWGTPDGTGGTDFMQVPDGPETFVSTVCRQCPGGCGVRVRLIGERAVRVDGNPDNPVSRGTTCPRGQVSLQAHYHPARLRGPVRREGDAWREVSWSEAMGAVAEQLKGLRGSGRAHTVAFLDGEEADLATSNLFKRFVKAYGSPNYLSKEPSVGGERLMRSPNLDGKGFYDLDRADYVLALGFDLLDSFHSPVQATKAYSRMRDREVKLTYVGSRLSVTGIKADDWVRAVPCTQGLVALGIAKAMLEEGTYDQSAESAEGFRDFAELAEATPFSELREKTRVSEEGFAELAEEFASHGAGAVALGNSPTTGAEVAVNALNLLSGSAGELWRTYDHSEIPLTDYPEPSLDLRAEMGLSEQSLADPGDQELGGDVLGNFLNNVINEDPYGANLLFIHYANPLLSVPNPGKVEAALESIPFVVSFSPFLDETAEMSDIVLPDTSPMERRGVHTGFLLDGSPYLGLSRPVVEPRYSSRPTGDVVLDLARAVGLGDSFPWSGYGSYLDDTLRGVYESGQGEVSGAGEPGSFEAWKEAVGNSAWVYPGGAKGLDGAPGLRTDLVESMDGGELPGLCPGQKRLKETEYSFHLNVYKLMGLAKPRNTAQPSLFDVGAPQISEKWNAWVEMHPEAASRRGISDGDYVYVESPMGRVKAKAKLYEGTVINVVSMPLNIGSRGYEPWETGEEVNPMRLVKDGVDPVDGRFVNGTKVKVYRA